MKIGVLSPFRAQTKIEENSLPVISNVASIRYTMAYYLVLGEVPAKRKLDFVKSDFSERVMVLRNAIYAKKKNAFSSKSIDENDLILWKVDIPFDIENDKLTMLDERFDTINIERDLEGKEMLPVDEISKYLNFEKPPSSIHILVQPPQPATTDQGHTDVSRDIATLGYLPRQGGLGGTLLPTDLKVKSTNEGIILTDPDISLRFDIIPPLIRDLMKKRIILIRAPPFAGKTSIAQILENALVQSPEYSNCRVIRVSMIWGISAGIEDCYESFGELWKEMFGIGWNEWIGQCRRVKTILIIDEAQLIYKQDRKINKNDKKTADQFWTIVKGCLQEIIHIAKVLLTSNQQSIFNFYAYIQEITDGHAGLVRHILVTTEDAMNKRIVTNRLTFEDIFKYLNSKSFYLSIYANCRAVPKVSSLSDPQRVKSGILIFKNDNHLTFAAPLLKRSFFQQNYGSTNSTDTTPTDLHHFIEKIFTAMCNEISGGILRNTLGFGSDGRLLEQTWQKEFYRIGTQILGMDHFLSCEVGSVFGCKGKIDFYVDKLDWAIELLRDGEDMEDHKTRFGPSGDYEEIVLYAKSIAIIDIRSIGILDTRIEAKKVLGKKEDFIYVSCSENFDAFKIECLGKETVTIRFKN
ncbi:heat shock protein Hsp70 family protein [Rhizophagus clarus]|uniref:Heat shock protein Hsp70 family protein n=1 Tax=Rhizophagus clarus TaxID=94130 RepID=A0A8H3KPS6_9GLOM|nr:heat shock protein Hsp70 family protein [Rhizophagus clarus]